MGRKRLRRNYFKRKLTALTICLSMVFSILVNNGTIVVRAESGQSGAIHLGDVDLDGTVTLQDAQLALRASLMLTELSDKQMKNADLHDQGNVVLKDAQLILRHALLLESIEDALSKDIDYVVSHELDFGIQTDKTIYKIGEHIQINVQVTNDSVIPVDVFGITSSFDKASCIECELETKDGEYMVSDWSDFAVNCEEYHGTLEVGESVTTDREIIIPEDLPSGEYVLKVNFRYMQTEDEDVIYSKTMPLSVEESSRDVERMVYEHFDFYCEADKYSYVTGESIKVDVELKNYNRIPIDVYGLTSSFGKAGCIDCALETKDGEVIISDISTAGVNQEIYSGKLETQEAITTEREIMIPGDLPSGEYVLKVNFRYLNYDGTQGVRSVERDIKILSPQDIEYIVSHDLDFNIQTDIESYATGESVKINVQVTNNSNTAIGLYGDTTSYENASGIECGLHDLDGRFITCDWFYNPVNNEKYYGTFGVNETITTQREIYILEDLPSGEYTLSVVFRYLDENDEKGACSKAISIIVE